MASKQQEQHEKKPRSRSPVQQQPPLQCPRCGSWDTKFCYYYNYSLSQPRYYCNNCKRYWNVGRTLRKVPVRGRPRKGRRNKSRGTGAATEVEVPAIEGAAMVGTGTGLPDLVPAADPLLPSSLVVGRGRSSSHGGCKRYRTATPMVSSGVDYLNHG